MTRFILMVALMTLLCSCHSSRKTVETVKENTISEVSVVDQSETATISKSSVGHSSDSVSSVLEVVANIEIQRDSVGRPVKINYRRSGTLTGKQLRLESSLQNLDLKSTAASTDSSTSITKVTDRHNERRQSNHSRSSLTVIIASLILIALWIKMQNKR